MTENCSPCDCYGKNIWSSRFHRSDVPQLKIRNIILTFIIFSVCTSFRLCWYFSHLHLLSLHPDFLFSPLPTFIGPWRGGSVKLVRSLLIKSSSVSTLPLSVFLPISKVSGGLKADQSSTSPPRLSSNQTIPVSMLSVSLCLSFFLSFFFLSFFLSVFPPFTLCARACTCSHPSSRGAPRLSGPVR